MFSECTKKLIAIDGMDKLLEWLDTTDYFTAPASTIYHGNYPEGLYKHSVRVALNILRLSRSVGFNWDRPESPYIIGLFHDLCKVNFYTQSTRNVKNESTGQWEKVPFYQVNDQYPLGHGFKSVVILQKYVQLTDQEIFSIAYHMHAFGLGPDAQRDLSKAINMHPEILLVSMADSLAAYTETNGKVPFSVLED